MGWTAEDIAKLHPEYQKKIYQQVCEKQAQELKAKENKLHAQKDNRGAIRFDSKKEALRYDELMMMLNAGAIRNLKLQKTYVLQEGYTETDGTRVKPITYKADFDYERKTAPDSTGVCHWLHVTEDVKGLRTRVYINKSKMFRERYGYPISEV